MALPAGWGRSGPETALVLQPTGQPSTRVEVYYELAPQLSLAEMARKTADFLRDRIAGARLSRATRMRVGGAPAYRLTGRGRDAAESAVGVLSGPYRYLVVRTVPLGAPHQTQREAHVAELSFRPR
jgi:hypothetical protein